jgi:GAF domain-containing protein
VEGFAHAVASGELWVSDAAGNAPNAPLACVPLRLGDRVIGVICVFGLLVQKDDFEPVDYELFHLLATQAATALYASGLHAKATREARFTAR